MIFIAIGLIVLLVALVIVLYLCNHKTPLPEGCENLKIDDEKCRNCQNMACGMKKQMEGEPIEK